MIQCGFDEIVGREELERVHRVLEGHQLAGQVDVRRLDDGADSTPGPRVCLLYTSDAADE